MTAAASKPRVRSLSCTEREWADLRSKTPKGKSTSRWLVELALSADPTTTKPVHVGDHEGDRRLLALAEAVAEQLGPMGRMWADGGADTGSGPTMREELRSVYERASDRMQRESSASLKKFTHSLGEVGLGMLAKKR